LPKAGVDRIGMCAAHKEGHFTIRRLPAVLLVRRQCSGVAWLPNEIRLPCAISFFLPCASRLSFIYFPASFLSLLPPISVSPRLPFFPFHVSPLLRFSDSPLPQFPVSSFPLSVTPIKPFISYQKYAKHALHERPVSRITNVPHYDPFFSRCPPMNGSKAIL
jgi:hypothetical protein